MASLKTKMREYRTKKNLKQDELAKLAGVRRETIVHLEAGKYNPSLKLGMEVAKILDTTVEELFQFTLENVEETKEKNSSKEMRPGRKVPLK